jgi:hypothetical protein
MDNHESRSRARLAASVVLLVLIGASLIGAEYLRMNSSAPNTGSSETQTSESVSSNTRASTGSSNATATVTHSNSSVSAYWSPQPYFNASSAYASLGFPTISYSTAYSSPGTDVPYVSSEPNFTLQVKMGTDDYDPGYANILQAPVMGLKEAVTLAADYAKLDPVNYTLAQAVFYPGLASSTGVASDPEWHLFFAQTYADYWIFDFDAGGWPIEADVDALNGSVVLKGATMANLPTPGHYDLNVSSSSALDTVRAINLTDTPALTKNGTVTFMAPLVVLPGLSPNSKWVNASGGSRLAWIIELDYEDLCCSQGGSFAVDAQTGEIIGDFTGSGIGFPMLGYVNSTFVFSTASNMTVSQQTYPLNGSVVGMSGSVLAVFPNVMTVRSGSTASIVLNVSAGEMQNPPSVSFSFSNPFPDSVQNISSSGAPPGVSLQFSNPNLVLQTDRPAETTLLIAVDENAPPGTYFIELQPLQSPASQIVGGNVIDFFLTVWNGVGQWPPPPLD